MRWPFRRDDDAAQAPGARHRAPAALPSATDPVPPSPPPVVDAGEQRGWSGLGPITGSWTAQPPLTSVPDPRPPALLHARPAPPAGGDGAPDRGRVVGLARVVPATPVVPAPGSASTASAAADLPRYVTDAAPLRHAPVRPIVERAPLTQAGGDWVGEPMAPPPPVIAPPAPAAPPPVSPPAFEAQTEAGARFQEALANLHRSGLPRYDGGYDDSPPAPPSVPLDPAPPGITADPPRRSEDEITGRAAVPGAPQREPGVAGPPPAPLTHRRNSLAQSRRLGLGAPVGRDEQPAAPAAASVPTGTDDLASALERTRAEYETAIAQAEQAARSADAAAARTPNPASRAAAPTAAPAPASVAAAPPDDDPRGGGPGSGTGGPSGGQPLPVVRPLTSGARSGASTAPLRFRSAPRSLPPVVEAAPRTPPRAPVSRPPADLAQALRSSHGIDVADVEIRRDTAAATEAAQRKARAFTRGATVHLPEAAGSVASGAGRALLAHELVHAAQQRRLGTLPDTHSAEGLALEREALEAEQAYGGSAADLRHAPKPVTAGWVEDRLTQHADLPVPTNEPPNSLSSDQTQRIRWEIQQIARQMIESNPGALAGGGAGGGGGGGGMGASDVYQQDVGSFHAHTEDEYVNVILSRYNLNLRSMGMAPVNSLPNEAVVRQAYRDTEAQQKRDFDANKARAAEARTKSDAEQAERTRAETERKEQRTARHKQEDEALKQADDADRARRRQLAPGTVWTPGGGMQRPGAGGPGATGTTDIPDPAAPGGQLHKAVTDVGVLAAATAGTVAAAGSATEKTTDDLRKAARKAQDDAEDAQAALTTAQQDAEKPIQANDDQITGLKARTEPEFIQMITNRVNLARRAQGLSAQDLKPEELAVVRAQWAQAKSEHDAEIARKREAANTKAVETATTRLATAQQKSRDAQQALNVRLGVVGTEVTGSAEEQAAVHAATLAANGLPPILPATVPAVAAGGTVAGAPLAGTPATTTATTTSATTATTAAAVLAANAQRDVPAESDEPANRPVAAETPYDPIQPEHMEQLATRLYERLRSRLRTELLVDRERAGMLADYR